MGPLFVRGAYGARRFVESLYPHAKRVQEAGLISAG
ncbi:MAG: hypothetical protein QOF59_3044, partial [Actinomycetota bacterium]|nr:hypothetical protein [Actinomycetota bacterium]